MLSAPGAYALVIAERGGRLQLTIVGAAGEDDGVEVKIEPIGKLIETAGDAPGEKPVDNARDDRAVEQRKAQKPERKRRLPAIVGGSHVSGGMEAPPPRAPQALATMRRRAPERADATARQAPAREAERAPKLNTNGFGFVCHVARKGDIGAAGGEWIGGPRSPLVIEGLVLHWRNTHGVELEYQVLVAGAQWSVWESTGSLAGTRGRGLPIVGLRVRLVGDSLKQYGLRGEATFLGLPVVVEAGESLEFSSYAAVDPLVGLKLDLHRLGEVDVVAAVEKSDLCSRRENKTGGNAQLRVFKSMGSPRGNPPLG